MSTTLEILEAEVLKLAPADRSHLLERLIASLDSGDLKGKRIGSQWRLTRTQLADFLR